MNSFFIRDKTWMRAIINLVKFDKRSYQVQSDMIPMACSGLVSLGKRDKDPCCLGQISPRPS
jgi:hypothetical protein